MTLRKWLSAAVLALVLLPLLVGATPVRAEDGPPEESAVSIGNLALQWIDLPTPDGVTRVLSVTWDGPGCIWLTGGFRRMAQIGCRFSGEGTVDGGFLIYRSGYDQDRVAIWDGKNPDNTRSVELQTYNGIRVQIVRIPPPYQTYMPLASGNEEK